MTSKTGAPHAEKGSGKELLSGRNCARSQRSASGGANENLKEKGRSTAGMKEFSRFSLIKARVWDRNRFSLHFSPEWCIVMGYIVFFLTGKKQKILRRAQSSFVMLTQVRAGTARFCRSPR